MRTLSQLVSSQDMCGQVGPPRQQPMHVDKALQAMINKPARSSAGATMASSQPSNQSNAMVNIENNGSGATTSAAMPPPPEPSSDASMEASSDKRTREPPDTTTKPEGKSLKTSGEPSSFAKESFATRCTG